MSVLHTLVGSGVGGAVDAVGNALDKLFTSDEERAQAEIVLEKLRQEPHILQAEINKIEAAHRTLFVAGWRPFIGWVCGLGFAYAFLLYPILQWAAAIWQPSLTPPALMTDNMMELVIAMLGLGGLRTFEKFTGKTK